MKVAVYYSDNDIRIEGRPVPVISGGEVLVRMKASGICGTDVMHWYRKRKAPYVPGHEMAGEVVETGREVDSFKKGDRVFVSHHVPCFNCYHCKNNNFTACEALHKGNYEPGGFSEYIRVPGDNVRRGTFLLPDNMTFEEATLIEPLGCVIEGQRQLALKRGQTVLIIGSGVSGLLHIQLLRFKGFRIIATDVHKFKLNMAKGFGADHAIEATAYPPDLIRELNEGRLADRVILCAGSDRAVENALQSIERKGRVLFFAVPERDISIPSVRAWRDELSFTFSYGAAPEDLKEAIELISSGEINVSQLITHRAPLSDIQKGFNLASEARESLKVVVVPDGNSSADQPAS